MTRALCYECNRCGHVMPELTARVGQTCSSCAVGTMTARKVVTKEDELRSKADLDRRQVERRKEPPAYPHYFKPCPYDHIDVYRVLQLWEVTDPCLQHALKKVLCVGQRGHKDAATDIQQAIDSLRRWQQMRQEENCGKSD